MPQGSDLTAILSGLLNVTEKYLDSLQSLLYYASGGIFQGLPLNTTPSRWGNN